jgi:uncharacterized membrane protein YeaQ/YmgE (transglycosylase-associated protein family)
MTLFDFLILLIVAGLVGSVGETIAGFTRGGCLVSIVLGFIGAIVGMWIARGLDLPMLLYLDIGGAKFPIIWSVIGAAVFVAVIGFFTHRRR